MITPLMHILSCLDEKYEVEAPADILYLSRYDRELIIQEAKRLGSFFSDENKIWISESPTGKKMVSDIQVIVGKSQSLNPYTALLLTRVWKCFATYLREVDIVSPDTSNDDLSTDAVVLRLEGNPRYVYVYIYNTMETPSLSYDAKIAKLHELLMTIRSHSVVRDLTSRDAKLLSRMELHSMLSFWKEMLISDYIEMYGEEPPPFTEETIETIRSEMTNLGFYGFVNPLEMYQQFNSSRVARKVEINIDEEVVDFLVKVVRSGGVSVE